MAFCAFRARRARFQRQTA